MWVVLRKEIHVLQPLFAQTSSKLAPPSPAPQLLLLHFSKSARAANPTSSCLRKWN
jgi:hypothetical protein